VFVSKLNAAGSALVYSTYLGGGNADLGNSIAVDSSGNAYVTGSTTSADFPIANPLQATCVGCTMVSSSSERASAFVAKLNPAGSALVYSTYLGGSQGNYGYGIAADSAGNAYVTGYTFSTDFPTANPLQPSGADEAFVAKLNADGSALVYSTYLGGAIMVGFDLSDWAGFGIALDAAGNAYVTSYAAPFPTANPPSTNCGNCSSSDFGAFVAKLNPAGSALAYVAFLGQVLPTSVAVDPAANAYVTGYTNPSYAPSGLTTVNALQPTCAKCDDIEEYTDAFVSKLSPAPAVALSTISLSFGSQMVSSTSGEQSVTLTNSGDATLNVSIAATGDFAETNTCGTGVAAGANCTISVTFTPTAGGNQTGTLSINDNAAGSPQTVALTGTGEDFTLAAAPGSSTSATVAPGQPATYTLSAAGEGGFSQSVSFSCTGAPSEAACTVSPSPLTPGSSATNITVSVTTTAPSISAPRSRPLSPIPPRSPGLRGLLMFALVLAAMAWSFGRRKQPGVSRWRSTLVPLASGLLLTLALAGCGGGSASVTPNPGTPTGSYKLMATGSTGSGSATLSHSVTLTLTVS
jgi:hypothetical protein